MLLRSFGKIIYDIAQKYNGLSDFRKLEKLNIKYNKADQDITFMINCRNFNVFFQSLLTWDRMHQSLISAHVRTYLHMGALFLVTIV